MFQVVAIVGAVLLGAILLGTYWQLAIGLVLVVVSTTGAFASRQRLLALSHRIGTRNHYLARGACLVGLVLGLMFLGAVAKRFAGGGRTESFSRADAEQVVREQLEQKIRGKIDSIQLRDNAGDGFIGEARQGEIIWDVTVKIQDRGISWEAESRAAKQDSRATDSIPRKLAIEMYRALARGDYEQVVDCMWPGTVEEAGGREQLIKFMNETVAELKTKGTSVQAAEVEDSTEMVQDGTYTFVVLPTRNIVNTSRGKFTGRSFVLAISTDGGTSWKFVEGTALADQNDRDAFKPELPQSLRFPIHEPPRPAKE